MEPLMQHMGKQKADQCSIEASNAFMLLRPLVPRIEQAMAKNDWAEVMSLTHEACISAERLHEQAALLAVIG